MPSSTTYQIRLGEEEKKATFAVFAELGIIPAQAVKMFFAQVRTTQSIPFPIEHRLNAETIKVIEEAKRAENIVVCKDTKDLFLDILPNLKEGDS